MILIVSALSVAASSCANRVETRLAFPPAVDIKPAPEPAYPVEALQPGEAGKAAEDAWWNSILLWGRGEQAKVARICDWATDLGLEVPRGYCKVQPTVVSE
jgi:hypothetical protein